MRVLLKALALGFVVCLCLGASATQAEMIVHYTFDDGAATDLSGNGLDGVLVGPAVIVDDATRGSKVLELDGVDSNAASSTVTIPTSSKLDLSVPNEATVAAWILTEREVGNHQCIFSQGRSDTQGVYFGVIGDADPNIRGLGAGAPGVARSVNAITRNQWVHVAVVMSGSSTTFYINGDVSANQNQRTGNIVAPGAGELNIIGMEQYSTGRWIFDGRIDDFRIYNKALSAAEIQGIVPEPMTLTMTLMLLGALGMLRIRTER